MPDTTQMEAILKGFPNVMDFYQFKINSKNLDVIKVICTPSLDRNVAKRRYITPKVLKITA